MAIRSTSLVAAFVAGALLAGCSGARAPGGASLAGGLLVTLEDADAPPTVFLDGSLDGRELFSSDTMTVIRLPLPDAAPGSPAVSEYAQALVPSSIVGSPMSLAVSPDGAWAAVASARAGALDIHERLDDLAPMSRITLLDLQAWPPRATDVTTVCAEPGSVAAHPDGGRLCAVSPSAGELVLIGVSAGRFREVVRIPLAPVLGVDHAPRSAHWSPDGRTIAICLGPGGVAFVEVDTTELQRPVVRIVAPPTPAGRFVRTGAWTPGGEAFLALDTGWIDAERGRMAIENTGGAHLVRPGEGVVASATLEGNPHAIAVHPDGSRAVVTGLAKADPAEPEAALRRGGTLSLLRVGGSSLDVAHRTRCGSLPMDVSFDGAGANVLIADFATGRVEVFGVGRSRLRFTGTRIETNYGVHQVRVTP
ncbi:MAG: hypothetical protein ACF8QF_09725 [Phycisphaerales bacterium]